MIFTYQVAVIVRCKRATQKREGPTQVEAHEDEEAHRGKGAYKGEFEF